MVRRDAVVDWRRDSRTQYIHEIEESLSLTNQHFNCSGFNKWKIVENHKQTITSRSNNNLSPNYCWRSISWMLVVRHKTTEVQCFNSKNSISILTTTKKEIKRNGNSLKIINLDLTSVIKKVTCLTQITASKHQITY